MQFVRADHILRPTFATDAAGAVVWAQSHDPFGRVVSGAGSDARFAGQWFAAENGLHQNWMRDYDPTLGRYLQADPLGLVDGASVYGYVGGNSVNFSDPRGEQKTDPWPTSPNGKKDFICGNYRIICEVDPHKGRHCSWSKKNGDGRANNGKKTCIREDGTACEGSEAPPSAVMECLRERNFCPIEEPQPFSIPPELMLIPLILGGGKVLPNRYSPPDPVF